MSVSVLRLYTERSACYLGLTYVPHTTTKTTAEHPILCLLLFLFLFPPSPSLSLSLYTAAPLTITNQSLGQQPSAPSPNSPNNHNNNSTSAHSLHHPTTTMHRTYSMRQSRAPTVRSPFRSLRHPISNRVQASQLQNPPPPPSSTKSGRLFGRGGFSKPLFDSQLLRQIVTCKSRVRRM
jgi:hypothetical protein